MTTAKSQSSEVAVFTSPGELRSKLFLPRDLHLLISGFPSSDIQKVFTEAFLSIEGLVDGQINKIREKKLPVTVRTAYSMKREVLAHGTKGIILVGGLGTSPYLYEHLKKRCIGTSIDVLQDTGVRP